ncbi:MAG: hypothetical protein WBQ78_00360 [Gammaproteobacteria bacterium]
MSISYRDPSTMKYHAVVFVSLIALPSIFSSCFGHENTGAPEAANAVPEIKKPSEAASINNAPEVQQPGAAEAANDNPKLEKPAETEAMEAAIAYLNHDGRMTIKKSEFIAWGTYSEKMAYWPMKLRLTYKKKESDTVRQNEYALKISKDSDGKWIAAQYWAWRTDFK